MKIYTLLLLFAIPSLVKAQTINNLGRAHSNSLPKEYLLNLPELRSHIFKSIPPNYQIPKYARVNYMFSDQAAYSITDMISSGYVYSDWKELEDYVNLILEKVKPKELENHSTVKAYIVKDGNFNASMTSSGHMFINIGVFAFINDEATLAGILAHEMAHYYKSHSYIEFMEVYYNYSHTNGSLGHQRRRNDFSVKQELEADSLAMVWIKNSEYHISGILKAFQIMQRMEKQRVRLTKDFWTIKPTTHPLSSERLEKMQNYFKNAEENPNFFLINKEAFNRLKEECKVEILKCFLFNFNYDSCIETAFKFHLVDPNNPTYLYFLMESIRRKCYLNPNLWNENFITARYYEEKGSEDQHTKVLMKNDFFHQMDFGILALSSQDISQFQATFYWDGKPQKFRTNDEAFEFFYKLGKVLNCKECILSNALSQLKNKPLRDELLNEYLKNNEILFKAFAEKLLVDSIESSFQKKKLLVFNHFEVVINQGKESIPVRNMQESSNLELIALFDSAVAKSKESERIPLFLPSLKENRLNEL